jgi:hypothetical protein
MLCFRNGSWFKSEGAGQLLISATMGRQLIPFVMNHDRVKIGQPPWLPQRIVGRGRLDVTRWCADKWCLGPAPREQVPRGRTAADGRVASPAGSVSEPARPETAGNTPRDLTSRPTASESNKESWDFDKSDQDFGEKRNPPKPHASP